MSVLSKNTKNRQKSEVNCLAKIALVAISKYFQSYVTNSMIIKHIYHTFYLFINFNNIDSTQRKTRLNFIIVSCVHKKVINTFYKCVCCYSRDSLTL